MVCSWVCAFGRMRQPTETVASMPTRHEYLHHEIPPSHHFPIILSLSPCVQFVVFFVLYHAARMAACSIRWIAFRYMVK